MANLDFIYNRKSVRKFKDTPIPKEDIIELIKAGTEAPSPKHQQNWHFVVLQNKDIINEMADIVTKSHEKIGDLAKSEKDFKKHMSVIKYYTCFKKAPVVILVYACEYDMIEYKILKDKPECKELYNMATSSQAEIQTIGAAVENLLLAAANMGYGACYMTGPVHSRDKIYEVMGHDETKGELMALIPIGVPEDSSAPQPPRLPLEDVVTFID